jgi:hypothetical protein
MIIVIMVLLIIIIIVIVIVIIIVIIVIIVIIRIKSRIFEDQKREKTQYSKRYYFHPVIFFLYNYFKSWQYH